MAIGVDLDGVVCNLMAPWLDRYNGIYHDNLKPNDIVGWDMTKFVRPECGVRIYNLLDDSIYDNAPEIPGAVQSLKRLFQDGHEVYIITACGPRQVKGKWMWIRRHLPFLSNDNVIICNKKHLVRMDFLIDDCVQNLELAKENGAFPLLFAAPHNRNANWPYTRYRDWNHVMSYFEH